MSVLLSVGGDTSSWTRQVKAVLARQCMFANVQELFSVPCTGVDLSLACYETMGYILCLLERQR